MAVSYAQSLPYDDSDKGHDKILKLWDPHSSNNFKEILISSYVHAYTY